MRKLRETLGFTVVELLVALCVAGAVGAVAAPSYVGATKTAKSSEAKANLNTFFLGQKIYRANNGKYWNAAGASVNSINQTLGVNISSKEFSKFNYSGGDTSYQASFADAARRYSISDGGTLTSESLSTATVKPVSILNPTPTSYPTSSVSTTTAPSSTTTAPLSTTKTTNTTLLSDAVSKPISTTTTTTSPTTTASVSTTAPAASSTTVTAPPTTTSKNSTTSKKTTRKSILLEM